MTPTSDERREVAARLREFADTDVWLSAMFAELEKFGDTDRPRADAIADLIDPTCEVDSIEPVEYGEFNQAIGSAFHLTCGHTAMRALTDTPPAYCEECGARVVSDDGDR